MFLGLMQGCATIRKFGPMESRTLEARQLTQQAQSAIHRSDWDVAELKLLSAIDRCPEDNRARECLADVLWARGAKQAAVEQLNRSIELAGRRDASTVTKLGQMQLELGNPQLAQQCADDAISHDKTWADAWTLRGRTLRAQGQSQQALSALFRSLSLRQEDTLTRLEIARIFQEQGKPDRSLAILDGGKHETAVCPYRSDAYYLRGLVLRDLRRPDDAVAAFLQARDGGNASPELVFHLAEAQLAAGHPTEAEETLRLVAGEVPEGELSLALRELRARISTSRITTQQSWR